MSASEASRPARSLASCLSIHFSYYIDRSFSVHSTNRSVGWRVGTKCEQNSSTVCTRHFGALGFGCIPQISLTLHPNEKLCSDTMQLVLLNSELLGTCSMTILRLVSASQHGLGTSTVAETMGVNSLSPPTPHR